MANIKRTTGSDVLTGNVSIYGYDGADTIFAGHLSSVSRTSDNDYVDGGKSNDYIYDEAGNDTLHNDQLILASMMNLSSKQNKSFTIKNLMTVVSSTAIALSLSLPASAQVYFNVQAYNHDLNSIPDDCLSRTYNQIQYSMCVQEMYLLIENAKQAGVYNRQINNGGGNGDSSNHRGSWSSPSPVGPSTVIDTSGGCEGGSCVNILW